MPRPSISLNRPLLKPMEPHYTKFEKIVVVDRSFQAIRFLEPFEHVLDVTFVPAAGFIDFDLDALLLEAHGKNFMQSYALLDAEYDLFSKIDYGKLHALMDPSHGVRAVICGSQAHAISYAAGLLEKCAKNGVLDLRPKFC